jgi:soluble lytic murein transglycosylase-like protein
MSHTSKILRVVWLCTVLLFCGSIVHVGARKKAKRTAKKPPAAAAAADNESPESTNNEIRLKLTDGTLIPVDEAWESPQGIWYRQSGVTHLVPRDHVKTIERGSGIKAKVEPQVAKVVDVAPTQTDSSERPAWIYLVGGARVEADNATESPAGVWFTRGTLSVFLERSRIDHIEREDPEKAAASASSARKERGWSTGNGKIDSLIRLNGARYGVDPYLIFCVMEQESHFNSHALSPKGASGLMQLMPGTGARFGVRRPNDPAQNVAGGTRYLKQLIERFNGRVDLVLASYNAGEGAVIRFGHRVPPYKETRAYVKRISYRYRGLKVVSPTPGRVTSAGGA